MGEWVILIGFMGAGKTSVGQELAARLGCPMLDTDQLIEERASMEVSRMFETQGEESFRRWETKVLSEMVAADGTIDTLSSTCCVLSVGGGLPLREENRELLSRLGTVVYLRVRPETVLRRLEGDTTRPLLAGEDVEQKVGRLLAERGPVYESTAHLTVDVDGKSPEQIACEIEGAMGLGGNEDREGSHR